MRKCVDVITSNGSCRPDGYVDLCSSRCESQSPLYRARPERALSCREPLRWPRCSDDASAILGRARQLVAQRASEDSEGWSMCEVAAGVKNDEVY